MSSSQPFYIKQNDRLQALVRTFKNSDNSAIDLTLATSVTFRMIPLNSSVPKVNAAATVTDAAAGEVTYQWAAGDTDTPGTYRAEYQVEFAGVTPLTVPTKSDFYIYVEPELG
jgi:hypothetical protein